MAQESVFDKKLSPETTLDKVEGILEHFNLPPKVIQYIRANHKLIVICISIVVIAVVSWSLYDSHRKSVIQQGATALSEAIDLDGQQKLEKLKEVVAKYGSTTSALWAEVELAHLAMQDGKYGEAANK